MCSALQSCGRNALHWAALSGSWTVVDLILNASRDALVNQVDVRVSFPAPAPRTRTRDRPLLRPHVLCRCTVLELPCTALCVFGWGVLLLLPCRPWQLSGYSPLMVAVEYGRTNVVKVLLAHGADREHHNKVRCPRVLTPRAGPPAVSGLAVVTGP